MLAIQKPTTRERKCVPNVLPCRINHNGAVNASKKYWDPIEGKDGKTIAYFRGRKLHGRKAEVPSGYKGVVLSSTEKTLPKPELSEEDEELEDEEMIEVGVMDEKATFDEVMVWGHGVAPDGAADSYLKGIEEWIGFSEQVHSWSHKKRRGLDGVWDSRPEKSGE